MALFVTPMGAEMDSGPDSTIPVLILGWEPGSVLYISPDGRIGEAEPGFFISDFRQNTDSGQWQDIYAPETTD